MKVKEDEMPADAAQFYQDLCVPYVEVEVLEDFDAGPPECTVWCYLPFCRWI